MQTHLDEEDYFSYVSEKQISDIHSRSELSFNRLIKQAYFYPYVIFDPSQTHVLRVSVDTPNVEKIVLKRCLVNSRDEDYDLSFAAQTITLYDDGRDGDEVAGDGLFSSIPSDEHPNLTAGVPSSLVIGFCSMGIHLSDGSVLNETLNGLVRQRYFYGTLPSAELTIVDENFQYSSHAVNVTDPNYSPRRAEPSPYEDRALTVPYYDVFPDDRQFLMVTQTKANFSGSSSSYTTVRREERSISSTLAVDDGAQFGSPEALRGIIDLGNDREISKRTLLHEINRAWCNYLGGTGLRAMNGRWSPIDRENSAFRLSRTTEIGRKQNGVLYEVQGTEQPSVKFNDLELYLSGLQSIDQVDFPIRAILNPVFPTRSGDTLFYSSGRIASVYKRDILAVDGPHIPDYTMSRKSFNAALIVVSDVPLSAAEMGYFDYIMKDYESEDVENLFVDQYGISDNFYSSTGGLGRLITQLPAPFSTSASCTDGILNGDEIAVDCGGSCPSCVPSCTDGIQNGDETGVDCGGSCADCNLYCNRISISPEQFYTADGEVASGFGAIGSLADEQDSPHPNIPWLLPWTSDGIGYVDLGKRHQINRITLFDGSGAGDFIVSLGLPEDNNPPIVEWFSDAPPRTTINFLVDIEARYLTFRKSSSGARINELRLCGIPVENIDNAVEERSVVSSFDFSIQPNPATSEELSIQYTVDQASTVDIEILTTNGQFIYQRSVRVEAGPQTHYINEIEASGMYFVRLRLGEKEFVKKWVKL